MQAVSGSGERFGAVHIVDILLGKMNERIASLHHDQMPVFGTGTERPRVEWQSLVRQMAGAGLLIHDVGGFGGLSIAQKGRDLMQGEGEFRYRRDMIRASKRKMRTEAIKTAGMDDAKEALLARLKLLRSRLAGARRVPAYVVFSDRTLIDMAMRAPRTLDDFAQVHGVGAAKLKEFGATFLAEIAG